MRGYIFMILILSKSRFEPSTEDIMDWLDYKDGEYFRLNGDEFNNSSHINENGEIEIQGLDITKIKSIWFRRWLNEEFIPSFFEKNDFEANNYFGFTYNILSELSTVKNWFFKSLKEANWLSHPNKSNINKLNALNEARKSGLVTPNTIITTKKSQLKLFLENNGRVITKPISNTVLFRETFLKEGEEEHMRLSSVKTSEITNDFFNELEDNFFPSLFQGLIEKEYEVRCFYLDSFFYSMAIFSQLDEQTSIDFRHYNKEKPNRTVPYKLPENIEEKIESLMQELNLNTGSVDLIKSINGEYVFLEINPVGQFGMTSYPCNYHLEEKIADYLIQNNQ